MTDEQLRRLTRDKQPRPRSMSLGQVVGGDFVDRLRARCALIRRVEEALLEVIHENFTDQCCVLNVERGKVTVGVRDPSLIDVLRRTHLFDLREHLPRAVPDLGAVEILFRTEDF